MKDKDKKLKNKEYAGFKNLKKSLVFYKKYKGNLAAMVLYELFGGLAFVLVPIFAAELITAITDAAAQVAFFAAVKIAAVSIFGQIMYLGSENFLNTTSIKVKRDLRYFLVNKTMSLTTCDFDKTSSGFFISRLITDANVVANVVANNLADLTWALTKVVFVGYIYFLSPIMGAYITLMLVIMFVLSRHKRKLYNKNETANKKNHDKVNGAFTEVIRGVRDIKILGIKLPVLSKVDGLQDAAVTSERRMRITNSSWFRVIYITRLLLEFGFITLGIYLALNNMMDWAALIVIYLYKDNVIWFADVVNDSLQKFTEAEVAAKRLYEVIDGDKGYSYETFGVLDVNVEKGGIEFKDVDFAYGENNLFKNLNFKIEPHTSVAFVGKSGEGKTTIFNIITRAYPYAQGAVLVDGIEIKEFNEPTLRKAISGISQKPYIFDCSFSENLRLVKPDATQQEVEDACKKAYIHDFIIRQKEGYDTVVGENGVVLSGGQAQRLAIARVLLSGSKILLLDEATSALDNESQGKIQQALEELQGKHTVLIIAHRLSTIVNCDKILVIADGKIAAEGRHKDLMKTSKIYRELYNTEEI